MARTKRIPSPEEIAARVRAREMGIDPAGDAIKQVEDLKVQVDELKAGVKKKRTAQEMRDALDLLREKYDFSAAEELIKIAIELKDKPLLLNLRIGILETLIEYEVPKLKSVEVTGEVEHNHTVTIVRYGEDGSVSREKLKDPGPVRAVIAGPTPQIIDAEIAK